jgi:hypothetical protein
METSTVPLSTKTRAPAESAAITRIRPPSCRSTLLPSEKSSGTARTFDASIKSPGVVEMAGTLLRNEIGSCLQTQKDTTAVAVVATAAQARQLRSDANEYRLARRLVRLANPSRK